MPAVFGKEEKKKILTQKLENVFESIRFHQQINAADFPDTNRMKEQLQHHVKYCITTTVNLKDKRLTIINIVKYSL